MIGVDIYINFGFLIYKNMGDCHSKRNQRQQNYRRNHSFQKYATANKQNPNSIGDLQHSMKKNSSIEGDELDEVKMNSMIFIPRRVSREAKANRLSRESGESGQSGQTTDESDNHHYVKMQAVGSIIEEEENLSIFDVYSSKKFMEFTLSRQKAGPVTVPVIPYSEVCKF